MSNQTSRGQIPSDLDMNQVIRSAFNEVDCSLTSAGFLTGLVGRKVAQVISTTSVTNDTATFTFSENGTTLYVFKLIFTDGTQATLLSAERIS